MNELKFKFFDTPDKCLFYLESQALQYIQFKDNNAEYRRLIDEAGLNMRIAFSIENFSKTATPEHTDLVKRIRNNDFKTLDDFYKNLGSLGKAKPRGKLLKDLKKRTNQTQFQKEQLGNAFIENKLLLSEAKKVAFELAEIDADNALVQTTALKLSKQFSRDPLSKAQMITLCDFIERQISKHLRLDRIEAKILDEDNNTVSFSAPDNYNGSENFTITVSDGDLTDTQVITVMINAVNDTPIATTGIAGTTPEGTSVSIALSGSDVDGDVLTFTSFSEPTNGTLEISGSYATYTPNDYFNGDDSFTFEVSDGQESDTAIVALTVTAVNDAPVLAEVLDIAFDEDGTGSTDLSATDIDEGDTLSYEVTSSSSSVVFVDGTQLTITPEDNYNGSFDVTVLVSDQGGLSDSQIFTLTVNPVNDPPVIEAIDSQQISEDGLLEVSEIVLREILKLVTRAEAFYVLDCDPRFLGCYIGCCLCQ